MTPERQLPVWYARGQVPGLKFQWLQEKLDQFGVNNFPKHGIYGGDDMMKQWILGCPWVPNVQTPLKERQTDPSIETWDCADPADSGRIKMGARWQCGRNGTYPPNITAWWVHYLMFSCSPTIDHEMMVPALLVFAYICIYLHICSRSGG